MVGAEIVIGIMIVSVAMIASVIEIQIGPAIMTRGVAAGRGRGQRSVQGIMIATGTLLFFRLKYFLSFLCGLPLFLFYYSCHQTKRRGRGSESLWMYFCPLIVA